MTPQTKAADAQTDTESADSTDEYDNDLVECIDINSDNHWVDLEAQVLQLWEPTSDSIAQVGLLGDGTDRVKFVSWQTSNLPKMEEGESYALSAVVTSEYEGQYSINLNKATSIEHLDGENAISLGSDSEAVQRSGVIVAIQPGSGLIKRCPYEDCSYALQNGRCGEHGHVDGEYDLRIKAVLDSGVNTYSIVLNAETTTALTGIDLDDAIEMAREALDATVVTDEIKHQIRGRYYDVSGPVIGDYHFVNSISANDI